MKIILNNVENYLKTRKEYEDDLINNVGGIYTKLINEKTREGREKIIEEDEKKQKSPMNECLILGLLRNLFLEQYRIHIYKYNKDNWDCEEIICDGDLEMPKEGYFMKLFEEDSIERVELFGELGCGLPPEKIMEIIR